MSCTCEEYGLPTLDFVGGSTQKLIFNMYHINTERPYELTSAEVNFSAVSHLGKMGYPIISKTMEVSLGKEDVNNVASVILDSEDTVNLSGKYIYQISIKDIEGNVEVPGQGILYITDNINRSFITDSQNEPDDASDE